MELWIGLAVGWGLAGMLLVVYRATRPRRRPSVPEWWTPPPPRRHAAAPAGRRRGR